MKRLRLVLIVIVSGLLISTVSQVVASSPKDVSVIGTSYTKRTYGYPIMYLEKTDYTFGSALNFKPYSSKEVILVSFLFNTIVWIAVSAIVISLIFLTLRKSRSTS